MPNEKLVELTSGITIKVKPLPFKSLKKYLSVIFELVNFRGDFSAIISDKWDSVVDLFNDSVVGGETEVDKISGFEDPVNVLKAIYEVNGTPQVLSQLNSLMGGAIGLGTAVVEAAQPEEETTVLRKKAEAEVARKMKGGN